MSTDKRLLRLLILPGLLLCAGCITTSAVLEPPPPPDCSAYVPDELKQDTPHASPPALAITPLDVLKNWIAFGIAEAGQTEKSNADRRAERHIREVCEAKYQEALARASKKLRPWYKRIF